jgi:S-DNA-T family DNA segregation ATPase FtsK/SpoIIIE
MSRRKDFFKKRKKEFGKSRKKPEPREARGIWVVSLFVLSGITFLSTINLAGRLGAFLKEILKYGFGLQAYLIPFILAGIAFALFRAEKGKEANFELKKSNLVGLILFVLSLASVFHLFFTQEEAANMALEGRGGGFLGYGINFPLRSLMGFWATLIISLSLFVISIILMFNTSPREIWKKILKIKEKSAKFSEKLNQKLLPKEKVKISDFSTKSLKDLENKNIIDEEDVKEDKPILDLKVRNLTESPSSSGKEILKQDESDQKTNFSITRGWKPYPLNLLDSRPSAPTSGDIKKNIKTIQQALANFGIEVEMQEVNIGPTVTQYTLKPAEGVKLSKITSLQNDLALALAAHPLRIEAPIPGRSLVGIEIPNRAAALVRLREILESKEFSQRKSNLTVPLGRNVAGHPVVADLRKMPHLLISGATGSGKSICLNSVILSLLNQNSPSDLKLILVDPKKVEMTGYNKTPHLLTPVITEVDKTVNSLKWLVSEMERRFKIFSEEGSRDIVSYNQKLKQKRMPYLVLIIDELADLMATAASEVEACIVRLAQMARATGIHLILATQRPSVNVITGLIKANITSRIAFAVASQIDSRTIIDMSGAEKLLGNGDMLYLNSELGKPRRIQGAYVSEDEIKKVTLWFKKQGEPEYNEEVLKKQVSSSILGIASEGAVDDELFEEAKEIILQSGKASASLLQRRLSVGYARAARLLDILEEKGIIGPANGAKPREILIQAPASEEVEDVEKTEEEEDDTRTLKH